MVKNGTRHVLADLYEHMDAFLWIQPRTMSEYPRVHDIYGWQPRSTPLPTQNIYVEVSVKPTKVWIYDMHVHHIYVDNRHVLLYQTQPRITYIAMWKAGYDYAPDTILHVYEIMGIIN